MIPISPAASISIVSHIQYILCLRLLTIIIMVHKITNIHATDSGDKGVSVLIMVFCGANSSCVSITIGAPLYIALAKSRLKLSGKNCCLDCETFLSAFIPNSKSSPNCDHS